MGQNTACRRLLVMLLLLLLPTTAMAERCTALVIGNAAYETGPCKNASGVSAQRPDSCTVLSLPLEDTARHGQRNRRDPKRPGADKTCDGKPQSSWL